MTTATLDTLLQQELPAARRGCTRSYGRIVLGCQNTVTAIALAITRDVQASEDIAQEAFIKAWQQLNQLNNGASFLPWLRQITRNLARDWLRANHNRPLSGEAAEIAIGMAADPAPDAVEAMSRVEEELAAEEIISALPEDSRETLLLFYREGQSSQQVARLLGLSDAAVRKRLSRARATVRDELLKRFGEFARSTAPGTAFAAAVCSTVMLAAPGTASAIVFGTAAGAGKLGASGLGTTTLGGGAAAGTLGATVNTLMPNSHDILLVIGSIAFGMLSAYLSSLYLLRYAETAQERTQLRRFLRLHVTTAFLFCTSTMATVLLRMGPLPGVLVIAVGMTVLNYQYLVSLPRVMAPMLARDAARHGRRGPTWVYRSLFGRSAVVGASLLVVVAVAYALMGN
ncbi:sigma-70 family RNA polymerase sigma factor [Stenotrophomonas sp. MH1]|uniref:RNA polymerase sigma factor n=1 Tax=Stenotrophomonas capsici TaxID=3110230 RepID=A0ABU5V1B7_9GAMM|nr:sigma-70 family RNA polymerase sigma factor [Stenotrophomonas sp. MH1]MEA5666365.1 sigma-70 family RNA polymerase sigma factor [Stenotrophomonas sp. MH1]